MSAEEKTMNSEERINQLEHHVKLLLKFAEGFNGHPLEVDATEKSESNANYKESFPDSVG